METSKNPGWLTLIGIFFITLSLAGCSSARMSDREADSLFRQGKYDAAAEHLKQGLEKQGGPESRDGLLYLLDIGLALHSAGKYDESIQAFQKADKIAEIKDYTSLSTESATLLTSDNITQYKGEDFEKVLISAYLSMDYALTGQIDDALVEARRVNQKLYRMITEGKRKYQQSAFARYLSGMLYEAQRNYNDAYIDYKFVYQLEPDFRNLGLDLWRTAKLSGIREDMERWDQTFGLTAADHAEALKSASRSTGEIIVLYQNGISPVKRPHPNFGEIPKFYPRRNPVSYAQVEIAPVKAEGEPEWKEAGTTAVLDNIETVAIENLDEKYSGIVARKLAGVVAKEAAGYGVEKATKSPILGALTKIALYASDQADLRSWNLLPHDLQVSRIVVPAGTYRVKVSPVGASPCPDQTVQVLAGKKAFVTFRYMP